MLSLRIARFALAVVGVFVYFTSLVGDSVAPLQEGRAGAAPHSTVCEECRALHGSPERLVLVVVDGLRYSRVFRSGTEFTKTTALLKDHGAAGLSLARPPTVTLPRLKSIMSGKVSVFSDILYNFFGSSTTDRSFLTAFRQHLEKHLTRPPVFHLYGDDTWLRQWPEHFSTESDPVKSFFVSDYTDVDLNVSRHIATLKDKTWDLAVLHYLGVDHIGHYLGSDNNVMREKERQMDEAISYIFETTVQHDPRTYMVVVSDHGMTAAGNHGGSSTEEVETVFMGLGHKGGITGGGTLSGRTRNPSTLQQTDIAATLSLVMGFPPPEDSTGVFFSPLFDAATMRQCISCNALQMFGEGIPEGEPIQKAFERMDETSSARNLPSQPNMILSILGAVLLCVTFFAQIHVKRYAVVWALHGAPSVLLFSSTFSEEAHKLTHFITINVLLYSAMSLLIQRLFPTAGKVVGIAMLLRLIFSWTQSGILAMETPAEHPRIADVLYTFPLYITVLGRAGLLITLWVVQRKRSMGPWVLLVGMAVLRTVEPTGEGAVWMRWGVLSAGAFLMVNGRREDASVLMSAMTFCVCPAVDVDALLICCIVAVVLLDVEKTVDVSLLVPMIALCAHNALGRSISLGHFQFSSVYDAVLWYDSVSVSLLVLLTHYGSWAVVAVPFLRIAKVRQAMRVWYGTQLVVSGIVVLVLQGHLFVFTVFMPRLMFASLDALFVSLILMLFP